MWARVSELHLGLWLVFSPFIFRGTPHIESFMWRDIFLGAAVVVLSLFAFWRPTRRAHLVTAALAIGLGLVAYFGWPRPGPPAAQNELTVAMMLLLLAIVPNEATLPPEPWRRRG